MMKVKGQFWRRSSTAESPQSTPACSENVRSYAKRRSSDAQLSGHQLAKLKNGMRNRKQSLPLNISSGSGQTRLARGNSMAQDTNKTSMKGDSHIFSRKMSLDSSVKNIFQANLSLTDTDKKYSTLKSSSAGEISTMNYDPKVDPNILYHEEIFHKNGVNSYCDSRNKEPDYDMFGSSSSKILDIFRSVLPDEPDGKSEEVSSQNSAPSRRFSVDSRFHAPHSPRQTIAHVKTSSRGIKLIRPDQSQAMYISGADTLGALPENDDSRGLTHLRTFEDGMNEYFNTGRRLSCPVIFEGPETNEGTSSRKHPRAPKKNRRLTSLTQQPDSDLSSDESLDIASVSRQNSDDVTFRENSSGSSDEAEESAITTMLGNVSFIVDKRRKQKKSDVADEDKNVSNYDRVLSQVSRYRKNGDCAVFSGGHQGSPTDLITRYLRGHTRTHRDSESYIDTAVTSPVRHETNSNNKTDEQCRSLTLSDSSQSLSSLDNEAGSSTYFSDVSSLHH